ncbi:flagellar hook protein FlgE [Cobetia sp. 1CM21F]|uniref:flagellar hook protein FlgE n=1 Tax=Cobetia sp. 1CM21F TaxID=2929163 RepID=UPI002036FE6F|nr:flagellar hook protein FlgE [Cobetia sp. 1CM21F]MCK8067280.1 flagellar hook protein FlgE [Cobetia sp. 1CM21F]
MAFSQALSGLSAASTNLDVIGNNIANSETVGFKSSEAQFSDIYAGSQAAGIGVQLASVAQDFTSGSLESTGRDLDLAISGDGFLRFSDTSGQIVYSRNGQLNIDAEGYIVTAQGAQLTGYSGEGVTGEPVVLQIPTAPLAAKATQDNIALEVYGAEVALNLDAADPVPATADFDPTDAATYNYASAMTVYDSLGDEHVVTSFYAKTENNTWNVHHVMDFSSKAAELQEQIDEGVADPSVDFDPQTEVITFGAGGQLLDYSQTAQTYALANGASDLSFSIDFTGSTQYANDFEVITLSQNGYTSGSLVGVSFEEDGRVIGSYSNELKQTLGTIALANFANEQGLQPNGDNGWVATASSGVPLVGVPGEGVFGEVQSGVVEASNVDLTTELVDLIIAQRNYQSNAQTIKVQDEVQQSVINMR